MRKLDEVKFRRKNDEKGVQTSEGICYAHKYSLKLFMDQGNVWNIFIRILSFAVKWIENRY